MDKSCQSCGMPMEKPEDHGAGDVNNPYCKYCTDAQGNLLPKEQVRQKMINFYNRTMGQTIEQAAAEVDKIMARMPAWQGQTQPTTSPADGQIPVAPSLGGKPKPATPPVRTPAPEAPIVIPSSKEPAQPAAPKQPTEPSEPVTGPLPKPTKEEPMAPVQPEEETPSGQG